MVVPLVPARCPDDRDEIAEQFVIGGLTAEEAAAFEDHIILCPACLQAAETATTYVRAVRDAGRALRGRVPLPARE